MSKKPAKADQDAPVPRTVPLDAATKKRFDRLGIAYEPDDVLMNLAAGAQHLGISYAALDQRLRKRANDGDPVRPVTQIKIRFGRSPRLQDLFLKSHLVEAAGKKKPEDLKNMTQLQALGKCGYSTVRRLKDNGLLEFQDGRQFNLGGKLADGGEFLDALKADRHHTSAERQKVNGLWCVSTKRAYEMLGMKEYRAGTRCRKDGTPHTSGNLKKLHGWADDPCPYLDGGRLGKEKVGRRLFWNEEHLKQIAKVYPRSRRFWTTEEVKTLGTRPDSEIAQQLGRSKNSVWHKRDRLGIPVYKGPRKATPRGKKPKRPAWQIHPDFDGVWSQPDGDRALTLKQAVEERPHFTIKFLYMQMRRGEYYHPKGKLPSQKRQPRALFGKCPPRVSVLDSDVDLLEEGLKQADEAADPFGWQLMAELADALGIAEVHDQIRLNHLLKSGRESGELEGHWYQPEKPVKVGAGKRRQRPYRYDPEFVPDWARRRLAGEPAGPPPAAAASHGPISTTIAEPTRTPPVPSRRPKLRGRKKVLDGLESVTAAMMDEPAKAILALYRQRYSVSIKAKKRPRGDAATVYKIKSKIRRRYSQNTSQNAGKLA